VPSSLKILSLGNKFNQSIDFLPCSITHLEIKSKLNLYNLPSSLNFLIITEKSYTNHLGYNQQMLSSLDFDFNGIGANTKVIISKKKKYLIDKKIVY
jgi:hypothetical protein